MHTRTHFPQALAPDDLDVFLARGWYRLGQAVFTCRFVLLDEALYSAVWVRLPLHGYQFRKGLRKLLARNGRRFRAEVGEAQVDTAREAVYRRYRERFRRRTAPTLEAFHFDGTGRNVFDTREVALYDGDRLVAFSFFDLGRNSIQSVVGVYDPEYARFSLGLHTMLLEIEYGMERGYEYYYPGYVLPGCATFDYKLRPGGLEFYDPSARRWQPHRELSPEMLPAQRVRGRLEEVRSLLERRGVPCQARLYPPYEIGAFEQSLDRSYLSEPLFLACYPETPGLRRLVITFDVERETFVLERCARWGDLAEFFESFDASVYCLELLRTEERLAETGSVERVAEAVALVAPGV